MKSHRAILITALVWLCVPVVCQTSAQRNRASTPNPDEPAIHDYVLTMDKVQKYADVMAKLEAKSKQDPGIKSEMEKVENTDVYNVDKIKLVENSPHLMQFLRENAASARDIVLLPMTLITAGAAIAAQQSGGHPPSFVNPANIEFVKQHQSDLNKLHIGNSEDTDEKQQQP